MNMINVEKSSTHESELVNAERVESTITSSVEGLKTELEIPMKEDIEAMATTVRDFEEIAEKAKTQEQKDGLGAIREKITKAMKKFIKVGRNLTVAGIIALSVDYYVTHPDLETRKDEKGNIEYIHPDEETNHIINILSGRESVSLEEALKNFRGIIKTRAKIEGIELPEDFDTYTIDQIDAYIVSVLKRKNSEYKDKPGEIKEYFYDFNYLKRINLPEDESQEIYNLIWEVEKESGNPKIRFQTKGPSILGITLPESGDQTYRPHYDSVLNTLYIPMDGFVESNEGYKEMLAELSHAKQLEDNPFRFYFKSAISSLRIFSKGGFNMNKLNEAQGEEYSIPGSFEYEAHSIIQPSLSKKYEKLTRLKGVKGEKEN